MPVTTGTDGASAPALDESQEAEALFELVASELREHGARLPGATYRVQLNREFTFAQATEILPYLKELGITDLYSSPFFQARPESLHGYDVVNHNALNPAIGPEDEYHRMTSQLRSLGMGHLLDFVPNHMGIGVRDNAWWMDVLENGPSSLFAPFFDIDWNPLKSELTNKVLLPVLGDHYGRVLESGELQLQYENGAIFLRYYEHFFPLNPRTYPRILEEALPIVAQQLSEDDDRLLELQSIMTGFTHLPYRTVVERSKVIERRREKEILKRRLATLVEGSSVIAEALEQAIIRFNGEKGSPHSFDLLHNLLEDQAYRLSFWRVAAEEINYRRFFDVNDLAAIRMENPGVFAETHRFILQMIGRGEVNGLRIDHPDGLWDPIAYFQSLQRNAFLELCRQRMASEAGADASVAELNARIDRLFPHLAALFEHHVRQDPHSPLARPLYLVVEKILSRGELLPLDWPVHGTSGYDFTALVGALFVDTAAEHAITDAYERFTRRQLDFEDLVYQKKKIVLQTSLASELNVLAAALNRLSERDRHSRDFTLGTLTDALRETIACFPVYRTYAGEPTRRVSEHDRIAIGRAIRQARQRNPTTDDSVFTFVRNVLMLDLPSTVAEEDRGQWRDFVMKFQQLTGPVMAKGVEDTAFYVYNRLVSLNEVGGEPERFGLSLSAFHQANLVRQRDWPASLLATSTHDTKRSEDVRARISVLSELPERWASLLAEIGPIARSMKPELDDKLAPDTNEEYLFFQTVLGSWPMSELEGAFDKDYVTRVVDYMRKATKEAKVNTSWINASPEYDKAVERFVRKALAEGSPLRRKLEPLAQDVAYHGRFGALSQALLRLTSPGIPDTYQGNELWDFSLVDPDNRRPVNYALRRELLRDVQHGLKEGVGFARTLTSKPEDGRLKLLVTLVALQARRRWPEVFGLHGTYVPFLAGGLAADHVVAFLRRHGERELLIVAPRLTAKLVGGRRVPPIGDVWGGAFLPVDDGRFRNLFTAEEVETDDRDGVSVLRLDKALKEFPVALLERIRSRG
jgi:(1->4)-alpha-D-glucan 1-alpha-D-glucosylmutase